MIRSDEYLEFSSRALKTSRVKTTVSMGHQTTPSHRYRDSDLSQSINIISLVYLLYAEPRPRAPGGRDFDVYPMDLFRG